MKLPSSYIALDLETTGVSTKTARIVQITLIKIIDSEVVDTRTEYIDCGKTKITPEAKQIHKITKMKLAGCPMWKDVAWDYFELLDHSLPVITYNGTSFDIPILEKEFDRVSVPVPAYQEHIDVMKLAKERIPLGSYSLKSVSQHLKLPDWKEHDSEADTKALISVFEAIKLVAPISQQEKPVDPSKHALRLREHAELLKASKPGSQAALQLLTPYIAKIEATCQRTSELDCENEEEYRTTVQAEIFLKQLEKKLTKTRTDAVRETKTVIREIEKAWRDFALNPIKDALKHIDLVRQPYLQQQLDKKLEAQRQADLEAKKIAQQAKTKLLDDGMPEQEANEYISAVEHEAQINLRKSIEKVNKTVTKLGSSQATVDYEIRIVARQQVPKYLWSPDEKLILQEARKYGKPIPGVEMTPTFKHSTRTKRK